MLFPLLNSCFAFFSALLLPLQKSLSLRHEIRSRVRTHVQSLGETVAFGKTTASGDSANVFRMDIESQIDGICVIECVVESGSRWRMMIKIGSWTDHEFNGVHRVFIAVLLICHRESEKQEIIRQHKEDGVEYESFDITASTTPCY